MKLPKKLAIVLQDNGAIYLREIVHTTLGGDEGHYTVREMQWSPARRQAIRAALSILITHTATDLNRRNRELSKDKPND